MVHPGTIPGTRCHVLSRIFVPCTCPGSVSCATLSMIMACCRLESWFLWQVVAACRWCASSLADFGLSAHVYHGSNTSVACSSRPEWTCFPPNRDVFSPSSFSSSSPHLHPMREAGSMPGCFDMEANKPAIHIKFHAEGPEHCYVGRYSRTASDSFCFGVATIRPALSVTAASRHPSAPSCRPAPLHGKPMPALGSSSMLPSFPARFAP